MKNELRILLFDGGGMGRRGSHRAAAKILGKNSQCEGRRRAQVANLA